MTVNSNWTNPASATLDLANGTIVTEVHWDALVSNLYHLGGTGGHIGARVFNSGVISIADVTHTGLTFDSDRYDTDPNGEIHSLVSNTERLTCRTAGKYLIWAHLEFDLNANGDRWARLVINDVLAIAADRRLSNGAGAQVDVTITALWEMAVNDWVTLTAYQNTGGALNVTNLEFGMTKV